MSSKRYKIQAVIDEHTCHKCAELNGKIIGEHDLLPSSHCTNMPVGEESVCRCTVVEINDYQPVPFIGGDFRSYTEEEYAAVVKAADEAEARASNLEERLNEVIENKITKAEGSRMRALECASRVASPGTSPWRVLEHSLIFHRYILSGMVTEEGQKDL